MAIVNENIRKEILALLNSTKSLKQAEAAEEFAQKLANTIEAALKSATVTIQPGIPVSTPSGPGVTTGSGNGSLS